MRINVNTFSSQSEKLLAEILTNSLGETKLKSILYNTKQKGLGKSNKDTQPLKYHCRYLREPLGIKYNRTNAIARGGSSCDFRFDRL